MPGRGILGHCPRPDPKFALRNQRIQPLEIWKFQHKSKKNVSGLSQQGIWRPMAGQPLIPLVFEQPYKPSGRFFCVLGIAEGREAEKPFSTGPEALAGGANHLDLF